MPNSPTPLRRGLRRLLLLLALTALTWAVVIVWWRIEQRNVTVSDLMLYLVVLPFVPWLALALLQRTPKASATGADGSAQGKPPAAEMPSESAPLHLPLLGAWAVAAGGADADALLDALVQHRARPRPDFQLCDSQGYPLHCGRVEGLNIAALESQMTSIGPAQSQPRPTVLRCLALLHAVLAQVEQEWPFPHVCSVDTAEVATLLGAPAQAAAPDLLQFQVKLLLPAAFNAEERALACRHVQEHLAKLPLAPGQLACEAISAGEDAAAMGLFDTFRRTNGAHALLLVAADSALCASVTDAWQANGKLFGDVHPEGLMPGEAGFAILALSPQATARQGVAPLGYLTPVRRAQRPRSADAPGKPCGDCLIEVAGDALAAVALGGEAIGSVVCDADHRATRTLESIDAMIRHVPGIDAIRDRLALTEACGHVGAAAVPGLIAIATWQASRIGKPVLLFNVGHATDRAAALVLPPSPAQRPSPSPSPAPALVNGPIGQIQ